MIAWEWFVTLGLIMLVAIIYAVIFAYGLGQRDEARRQLRAFMAALGTATKDEIDKAKADIDSWLDRP